MAKTKWSNEKIISEIKRLEDLNSDLSSSNASREYKALYQAGKKYFGSWYQALEESGVNVASHVKRFYWTKEKLIEALKEINSKHSDLSWTFMNDIGYSSIPVTAKKLFGSYDRALFEAGFNPDEIHRKKPLWTDEEIRNQIQRVYETYGTLSEKYFRENHSEIISVCQTKFSGWFNALTYFGFPTDEVKTNWSSKKQVIEELKRLNNLGYSLAHTDVSNSLYLAASRRFEGWDNALKKAGIDPDSHRKYTRWTKEKMLQRIKEYHTQGVNMCNKSIFQLDSALASSYTMYFESWDDFLYEAGITEYDFSDALNKAGIGYRFQALLKRVFKVLNINVDSQRAHDNLRPDFTLNGSTWIDAKLSSWTALSDNTLKKYCPVIDFLLIIYLRGNPIEGNHKVNFIPVDDFFPALIKKGHQEMVEQLIELRKAADLADKAS